MVKSFQILVFIILLNFIPLCANAQTVNSTPSSTQIGESKTVNVEQAISILTTEVSEARQLIAANNSRISNLELSVAAEQENSQSFSRSYEAAKSEISTLKTANLALERAITSQNTAIALLQSELDKQKKRGDKWKKNTFKLAAVLAAILITKTL